MKALPCSHLAKKRCFGFTLVELLVALAVASVLATAAIPNFLDGVRKSRRVSAQALMMDVMAKQQLHLVSQRAYAVDISELDVAVPTSISAHYTLTLAVNSSVSPPAFTIAASPQGEQALDACGILAISSTGNKSAEYAGVAVDGCW